MTPPWFMLLWLLLALGSTLAGAILTQQRMSSRAPTSPDSQRCPRCQMPLEPGARFCGGCGHRLGANIEKRKHQHV